MTEPWNLTEAQKRQFREAHGEAKERARAATRETRTPKAPTASGISRLLGESGLERAVETKYGRHVSENTAGYHVHKFLSEIRVTHWSASVLPTMLTTETAEAQRAEGQAMLRRYAEVIRAAGWTVREQDSFAYLAVTAPKTEG